MPVQIGWLWINTTLFELAALGGLSANIVILVIGSKDRMLHLRLVFLCLVSLALGLRLSSFWASIVSVGMVITYFALTSILYWRFVASEFGDEDNKTKRAEFLTAMEEGQLADIRFMGASVLFAFLWVQALAFLMVIS